MEDGTLKMAENELSISLFKRALELPLHIHLVTTFAEPFFFLIKNI